MYCMYSKGYIGKIAPVVSQSVVSEMTIAASLFNLRIHWAVTLV